MKRYLQAVIGLAVGVGLLWFLFRGTNLIEIRDALRDVSITWLLVSLGFIVLSFFLRVKRWSYIVRTAKFVSFRHMFSATQIGFMANFILPARLGEVVRAVVLGKLTDLPFSKALAMVALDRVTDLFGLIVMIFITIFAYRPTGTVVLPASVFGKELSFSASVVQSVEVKMIVVLLAMVVALAFLYVNQKLVLRTSDACVGIVSKRLAARLHGILQNFADGLHVFRSASDMAKALGFSLVTWATFVLCMVSAMFAFHMEFPWYAPFVMEMLLAVFISVPGPPGFLGQFQYPIVIALMMLVPGMIAPKALTFSMVVYAINLVPIVAIGVFCLSWEKFTFFELTRESSHLKDEIRTASTDAPSD
ncbi:MAG: lysylphosphatidylglycerol synthase transmembrane domain-containing protein [Candidatus Hydrogenedentes bacterium]|nr:lysylphosphatidylglycerol synthase transmembrane domain-containing protein [Candidatus Hydrogenedentota bacterium]